MKKLIIIGILLAVVIFVVISFPSRYRHLMVLRLVSAAENDRVNHRYAEAGRLYNLAFRRDSASPELLHSYADFLDEIKRPEALQFRLRIIQLEPENVVAKLDAAEEALKYRQLTIAGRLLSHATPEIQKMTRYYDLVGWLQLLGHDLPDAATTWSVALKNHPGNKIYEANLETVRLSSPNEAVRNEAVSQLQKIAFGEEPPVVALSSLMVYATRCQSEPENLDRWLERFRSLVPQTNTLFTNYLDALRRWRPDRFKQELSGFIPAIVTVPDAVMNAQQWMISAGLYEEFLAFESQLMAPFRENLESDQLEAEARFKLKQNEALEKLLSKPIWNEAPLIKMAWQERIRRASQPQTKTNDVDSAKIKWSEILNQAKKSGVPDKILPGLASLAFRWGWQDEYVMTLWATVESVPSAAPDSLTDLYHFYLQARDAANVRIVVARELVLEPENPALLNNFAFLSFLLGVDTDRATKISTELCAKYPKTPLFISTRAFGLLKAGKPDEGLALFREIDVKQLAGTATGVCYGYLLAAKGDRGAIDYLKNAGQWIGFPEEAELVNAARKAAQQAQ